MKLISLLLGLVIVAYLINKQMTSSLSNNRTNAELDKQDVTLPKTPTTPEEVKDFEKDVNKLIQDLSTERNKELQKSL